MPEQSAAAEQRAGRRSNLFVIAALHRDGESAPVAVRIRNLSSCGALVEGFELPDVGADVRLSRGVLSVTGELMWRDTSHAGLRFSDPVVVADWLPNGARNSAQQRADQILFEARAGRSPLGSAPLAALAPSAPDYGAIASALARAGEELLADREIARRCTGALQAIDLAAQALTKLARGQ